MSSIELPEVIRPAIILLVEDNPADVRLTTEALRDGKLANELHVAKDGDQAMEFLLGDGKSPALRPDLILLDLNLPRKNGIEVLGEIKTNPALGSIPVCVLTSSSAETDIVRSYELHANCYVTKPIGLEDFLRVTREIEGFWLSIVRLPTR